MKTATALLLCSLFTLSAWADVDVLGLPTTTAPTTGYYLIVQNPAGGTGSTKIATIANTLSTANVVLKNGAIGDATGTSLTLTNTSTLFTLSRGSNNFPFAINASGVLVTTPTVPQFTITSSGGSASKITVTSTNSTSQALLNLVTVGGDPYVRFDNSGSTWTMGTGSLDSNKFKIGTASTPTADSQLSLDSGGNLSIIGALTTTTAASTSNTTVAATTAWVNAYGAFPRSHIAGFTTSPSTDVSIGPGVCRDCTNSANIKDSAGLTNKQLSNAWAVGSTAGFYDQGGTTPSTATFHIHAIKKDSDDSVDYIASLSSDNSATVTMTLASPCVVTWSGVSGLGHGLVAGSPIKFSTTGALPTGVNAGTQYYVISSGLSATTFQFSTSNGGSAVNSSGSPSGVHTCQAGPQMPAGYTYFREVWFVVRVSGSILQWQQDGDRWMLLTPVQDISDATLTTARKSYTLASLPVGLRVEAVLNCQMSHATGATMVVADLATVDQAPSGSASPGATMTGTAGLSGMLRIYTNLVPQICARSNASSTNFHASTQGCIFDRNRNR